MNGTANDLMESVRQEAEARSQALQRLLSGADASKVFGQPVAAGGYTVIPAAEIAGGGGFGSGIGFGTSRLHKNKAADEPSAAAEPSDEGGSGAAALDGAGGGGGGGGGAMGRPVAVIVLGPEGVEVRPVVDVTKLAVTALGAFGAVAALSIKMWPKK